MNNIGNTLITILMMVLFPLLIPFILFVAAYWIICGVAKSEDYKKEVDGDS